MFTHLILLEQILDELYHDFFHSLPQFFFIVEGSSSFHVNHHQTIVSNPERQYIIWYFQHPLVWITIFISHYHQSFIIFYFSHTNYDLFCIVHSWLLIFSQLIHHNLIELILVDQYSSYFSSINLTIEQKVPLHLPSPPIFQTVYDFFFFNYYYYYYYYYFAPWPRSYRSTPFTWPWITLIASSPLASSSCSALLRYLNNFCIFFKKRRGFYFSYSFILFIQCWNNNE